MSGETTNLFISNINTNMDTNNNILNMLKGLTIKKFLT